MKSNSYTSKIYQIFSKFFLMNSRLKYQRIHSKKLLTSSDQIPNLEATNPDFISKNLLFILICSKHICLRIKTDKKNANIFVIFTRKVTSKVNKLRKFRIGCMILCRICQSTFQPPAPVLKGWLNSQSRGF